MAVGALVGLGADPDALRGVLATLPVSGWSLEFVETRVQGIAATDARVHAPEESVYRHVSDIEEIIADADLPGAAAERAGAIFRKLAEAEAKVHGVGVEEIHFHEVGALDAIVDIVGVAVCLELLAVNEVRVTPIHVGTGTVECAHGIMPVPAPATLELLQGFPVVHTGLPAELTTPTGAALLATCATPVPEGWRGTPLRAAYGAGKRTLPGGRPNLLRATLVSAEPPSSAVSILEANVDDMSPELVPYVIDRLLEAGALDAFVVPIIMKHGRPASLFTVIAAAEREHDLARLLLTETTTLGVRTRRSDRHVVSREIRRVTTRHGTIGVKLARLPDGRWRAAPEYRDCAAAAREAGVPLLDVMEEARRAGEELARRI
ncbi:MAG: TIGR00299 family protein [Gemmatimonadetes bacterium]|nr:TIGR00299 family protein [Gemmatimonadota bacterium]